MTKMADVLSRSRASLDDAVRDALQQGRTVRSRNRDGEYAIILTDGHPDVVKSKTGDRLEKVADDKADWTIVVPDFTLANVANATANGEPDLPFFAPVFDRSGLRVGTITVNGSPIGMTASDQGPIKTATVFFSTLRAGDLFRESETNSAGQVILFRATTDATTDGYVTAETVADGTPRVFDLGPDYLAFKVISHS